MSGSIGEGMVDMFSNPTGDHRVVSIKRAAANFIDMIEQLQVLGDRTAGDKSKRQAMSLAAQACDNAVQAAIQRDPPKQPEEQQAPAPSDGEDETFEGAPV